MSGIVFKETLRRNWRIVPIYGGIMAVLVIYIILLLSDSKLMGQLNQMMGSMSFLVTMFGGGDAAFMGTPAGLMNYSFFGWGLLMVCGYAVAAGLSVTANEEEAGILDVLLSAPLPRWRLVVEKLLAHAVLIIGILFLTWVSLLMTGFSETLAKDPNASLGRITESVINMLPSSLLVLSFTALMGVLFRRRNTAMMIGAAFVVGSFLVDTLGRSIQAGDVVRAFSYFKYYDSAFVMQHGLVGLNLIGLVVVTLVLSAMAVWRFEDRELGI